MHIIFGQWEESIVNRKHCWGRMKQKIAIISAIANRYYIWRLRRINYSRNHFTIMFNNIWWFYRWTHKIRLAPYNHRRWRLHSAAALWLITKCAYRNLNFGCLFQLNALCIIIYMSIDRLDDSTITYNTHTTWPIEIHQRQTVRGLSFSLSLSFAPCVSLPIWTSRPNRSALSLSIFVTVTDKISKNLCVVVWFVIVLHTAGCCCQHTHTHTPNQSCHVE